MAGLACGEVSELAWKILASGISHFMTVREDLIAPAILALAQRSSGQPSIIAGESAVPGLAALMQVSGDPKARNQLGLDQESRVLLFGTEGATDPATRDELLRQFRNTDKFSDV
jgi:diaminopropionate ammonia-lyase